MLNLIQIQIDGRWEGLVGVKVEINLDGFMMSFLIHDVGLMDGKMSIGLKEVLEQLPEKGIASHLVDKRIIEFVYFQ